MAKLDRANECVIKHVTQTLDNNCTSASIAMITGLPIEKVTAEFHESYINMKLDTHQYLADLGVNFRRCYTGERVLRAGKVYLMVLPSLNIVGGNHNLVIQVSDDGERWYWLDPNEGRCTCEGKAKLTYPESEVVSWIPELEFDTQELLAIRKELPRG